MLAEGWALVSGLYPVFGDVQPGNAFYSYVQAAYFHNVLSGYADGLFPSRQPGHSRPDKQDSVQRHRPLIRRTLKGGNIHKIHKTSRVAARFVDLIQPYASLESGSSNGEVDNL